jgi:hypothetical protein
MLPSRTTIRNNGTLSIHRRIAMLTQIIRTVVVIVLAEATVEAAKTSYRKVKAKLRPHDNVVQFPS